MENELFCALNAPLWFPVQDIANIIARKHHSHCRVLAQTNKYASTASTRNIPRIISRVVISLFMPESLRRGGATVFVWRDRRGPANRNTPYRETHRHTPPTTLCIRRSPLACPP